MIVSTTTFSLEALAEAESFWTRVSALTQKAAAEGSSLILFPEYFSLSWVLAGREGDFRASMLASKDKEQDFKRRFQQLAERHKITIVAGTHPRVDGKKIYNRCWIFLPGKAPLHQDKIHMTRFEAEEWKVESGNPELLVFSVGGVNCAVAVCYDVEFPSYCSAAADAKVDLLLVPSCTDDAHGYWRVRHTAEARAIESQCFVLTSAIVEGDPSRPEIASHHGRGALLTPCDLGFPEGGCAKETLMNEEDVISVKLELDRLKEIRKSGTVLNLRDSTAFRRLEIRKA